MRKGLLSKIGVAMGLIGVASSGIPTVDATETRLGAPDSAAKQDDRQSTPSAPQTQTPAPQAVRLFSRDGSTVEATSGIRGPGFGPPPPAYTWGQRGRSNRQARPTHKVRTHKERRC